MCQHHVYQELQPVHFKYPQAKIIHYMDHILIAAPSGDMLQQFAKQVSYEIKARALIVASEKIQESSSWKYLEHILTTISVT
jgi:hypothetical protein